MGIESNPSAHELLAVILEFQQAPQVHLLQTQAPCLPVVSYMMPCL